MKMPNRTGFVRVARMQHIAFSRDALARTPRRQRGGLRFRWNGDCYRVVRKTNLSPERMCAHEVADDGVPAHATAVVRASGSPLLEPSDRVAATRSHGGAAYVRRVPGSHRATRQRALAARARARRSHRHAGLEPRTAPRGVLRRAARRLRPAHLESAPFA